MTTPIDDMISNLIEKLHAARFENGPPTTADLHQVAIALADTRRIARGTANTLLDALAARIAVLEGQGNVRIDTAFARVRALEELVATDKTDYRAVLGAVADLTDRVKKLEAPGIPDLVKGIAGDMLRLAELRNVPVTADRIATAKCDDLDEVAAALGLSRKGWPYSEPETDDALRVRCGAALFGQAMTRELAMEIAYYAAVAPGAKQPRGSWEPPTWVVDAVMAAAGVNADGRPIVAEESPVKLAERMRAEFEADPAHQTREYLAQGKAKRDELTAALGCAPDSIDWQRGLELVRETIEQRNTARAALKAKRENDYRKQRDEAVAGLRHCQSVIASLQQAAEVRESLLTESNERIAKQAQTIGELQNTEARTLALRVAEQRIEELQKERTSLRAQCDGLGQALDHRGQALRLSGEGRASAERTVIDQAAQITTLRHEIKRLVELGDSASTADTVLAALTGAT